MVARIDMPLHARGGRMTVGMRAFAAAAIAAAILLGLACPYFLIQGRVVVGVISAAVGAAAVVVAKRVMKRTPAAGVGGLVVGAIMGLVAIVNVFPYRGAAAAWSLTPETTSAQVVFGSLYPFGAILGGVLGSYISIRRRPPSTSGRST